MQKIQPILELQQVGKTFEKKPDLAQKIGQILTKKPTAQRVTAVSDVSLQVSTGKVLGLVGESGCGKSTLGRMITGLIPPSHGKILYQGKDIRQLTGQEKLQYTLDVQMVFQDPQASLNPKHTIYYILSEAAKVHQLIPSKDLRQACEQALEEVGLRAEYLDRYPHQLSGGQRQRVGIARALMVQPKVLVCDEPVAALDVSIQAQVINLFMDLKASRNLTYLFISHDLGVVRHLSDDVAIMYLGKVVEYGDKETIFNAAQHPYTQALLAEAPSIHRRGKTFTAIQGEIPSPLSPPSGCTFHPRCPQATERCRIENPKPQQVGTQHMVACHLVQS